MTWMTRVTGITEIMDLSEISRGEGRWRFSVKR